MRKMNNLENNEVLVFSSHVVRGSIGNRAMVFALEALGRSVWAFPTIILPWHPGHGPSTRLIAEEKEFESAVQDLMHAPWKKKVKAISTGYMANVGQIEAIARLIKHYKKANPGLLYLCDPVIGDSHGLYVKNEIAEAIKEHLLPLSDVATPNRYELAWLTREDPTDNVNAVIAQAKGLYCHSVLVTSVMHQSKEAIGNVWCSEDHTHLVTHPLLASPPNGPGDLTAGTLLGNVLKGLGKEAAVAQTTAGVFEIIKHAVERKSEELILAGNQSALLNPKLDAVSVAKI